MNQFAQLLSAESQTTILIDCCAIIGVWENREEALRFRERIAPRKDIRILVPTSLAREVAKVAKISGDEALALIESFSDAGQIDYIDEIEKRKKQAAILNAKYPGSCHFPDNYYLLLCKDHDATLITYDRDLRAIAFEEQVKTRSPDEFRYYK